MPGSSSSLSRQSDRESSGVPLLQAFLRRYARAEAMAVAPFVVGRRVLDLGAGEGYVGSVLGHELNSVGERAHARAPGSVWVCASDVGPFAPDPRPYVVYDGARLPFPDHAFDTTVLLLTLHHCDRSGARAGRGASGHPPPAHRDRVGRPQSPRQVLARSPRPASQCAPARRRHERSPRLPDMR